MSASWPFSRGRAGLIFLSLMLTAELLEGARNLVRYAEIRAGHEVLIHFEPGNKAEPGADDPDVLEALRSAVSEVGARASIMSTPPWNKTGDSQPPMFVAALEGTDFLIGQGEYLYTKNHYLQVAMFEQGLAMGRPRALEVVPWVMLPSRSAQHAFDYALRDQFPQGILR